MALGEPGLEQEQARGGRCRLGGAGFMPQPCPPLRRKMPRSGRWCSASTSCRLSARRPSAGWRSKCGRRGGRGSQSAAPAGSGDGRAWGRSWIPVRLRCQRWGGIRWGTRSLLSPSGTQGAAPLPDGPLHVASRPSPSAGVGPSPVTLRESESVLHTLGSRDTSWGLSGGQCGCRA